MGNIVIEAGGRPSRSARELAKELGVKRLRRNTRYHDMWDDLIINWGCTKHRFFRAEYLNHPNNVSVACDKLSTLRQFDLYGVGTVPFTTSREQALTWLQEGSRVVARKFLRSNSGRGIVLIKEECDMIDAPLYTKYIPKYDEYRVHVFEGEVIDVAQKKRRSDHGSPVSNEIRSYSNGWVFCRDGISVPDDVINQAIAAVDALQLSFGAADVGYTRLSGRARVYEVNTAPGLEGTTVQSYAGAISRRAGRQS